MRVSLNQIKQFVDFDLPPTGELVARINQQLGGVEQVIDLGAKYRDAVIVKIVECVKHPNADRLNVCKIDDGGARADAERDENGLVQVVCGAPNAHADMLAVWLPPGSTVPASADDAEPFVLDTRDLRGVKSNGMLAAADELAISSDHAGILEICEVDLPPASRHSELDSESSKKDSNWVPDQVRDDGVLRAGMSFAKTFGLDDAIIDIENKMFTHRPDCFGQLGVAREIAGILGHQFVSPRWYLDTPAFKTGEGLALDVFNDAPEKVPRFMAVALKNITVKPSPLWLQCALVAMGSKPINNIVDVTNYVMLLTAQPTHAYDYDKIRGHKIGARLGQKGEKITLLNGKTYELDADDIVIADGDGPVGLAGIMGGSDSEVDDNTKNIVLEVATFDMYAVRKTSMRHGIFTDALTRFNKGQSPLQNDHIMNLLMMNIRDVSSAEQASDVFDLGDFDDCIDNNFVHKVDGHGITGKFINDRLGLNLSDNEIATLLENVEFKINIDDKGLDVYEPFWRTDIDLPEDIVEEVGRLYGFDKLPRVLPTRSIKPAPTNQRRALKQSIRERLARAGASEVLTYSFVHHDVIEKVGQDVDHAYKLGNALSPDLQYYRLSLLPSLLQKIHMNIRAGYDEFALFELGKSHIADVGGDDGLPREDELTALVVTASDKSQPGGSAYYQAKRYLEYLLPVDLTYRRVPADMQQFDITKPYDAMRSAAVYAGNTFVGIIGELRGEVRRAFKLPEYTAGFELDTMALMDLIGQTNYQPLSRFPSTERDICFQIDVDTSYQDLTSSVIGALQNTDLQTTIQPVDIYQAEGSTTKNITIRLTLTSHDRTLTSDMVAAVIDTVTAAAKEHVNAAIV